MGLSNSQEVTKAVYPLEATPITASATGGAGASNAVSLAGVSGKTTYLTKAIVTSTSPAAQQSGVVTISDGTQTLSFQFVESTSAGGFMNLDFSDSHFVAAATNTAITVTIPAIGSGGATAIALLGYQR